MTDAIRSAALYEIIRNGLRLRRTGRDAEADPARSRTALAALRI